MVSFSGSYQGSWNEAVHSPEELNRLGAAAGAAHTNIHFSVGSCFHQHKQETLKMCE